MKKIVFLITVFCLGCKSGNQTKRSYTLTVDIFDIDGNKIVFSKKFDHKPTHSDSVEFNKSSVIWHRRVKDSLQRKKLLEQKTTLEKSN
jgi:hypothetical protein